MFGYHGTAVPPATIDRRRLAAIREEARRAVEVALERLVGIAAR